MNQEVQGGSVAAAGTSTAVVGDSGSGKTELLVTFADYIWNKYGKITLYYSADLGGFGNRMRARIQRGNVWVWRIKSRDPDDREGLAMATLAKATQGYWPKELNPHDGKCPQGAELIPQVIHEYEVCCPNCGIRMLKTASRGELNDMGDLYCAGDKTTVNMRNAVIKHNKYRTPGFENVGAIMFDGLTSMADWPMLDLARRGAEPIEPGEKHRGVRGSSQAVSSDDLYFGTSSEAHYSFAHIQAEQWLRDSNEVPGLVMPPLWTALEKRGQEGKGEEKLPIYGPDIPGKAKTAKIPHWVGNCLGTAVVVTPEGKEWRLHLTEYREGPNEPAHKCKTRISPGSVADFRECLTDGPTNDHGMPISGVPAFTKFNLGYYFDLEEEAFRKELEDVEDFLGDAPGMPSGKYGAGPEEPKELIATERVVQVPTVPIAVAASVPSPVPTPVPSPTPVVVPGPASPPEPMPVVQVTPPIPGLIPPPPPVPGVEAAPPTENPPPPDPPGNVIPPAGKRPVPPAAAAPRPK